MGTTAAIIAATAVAATGSVVSYEQQKHASDAARQQQQHANQIAQASSAVEMARRRRQAIAQARIAQAQNEIASGYTTQSTSAAQGVNSALVTGTQANIGFANAQNTASQDIFNLRQQASDTLQQGQLAAGLTQGISGALSQGLMSYGAAKLK